MKIDFHSHILPGIDDGSRSVKESIKILDVMAEDDVKVVVATPHFYCSKISIHRFLEKREAAYQKLKNELKPEHPKILLGAEVLYDKILTGKESISRLAISGCDYMLLEMPYTKLTDDMIDNVDKIVCDYDVKLIIAHIERYLEFTDYKSLKRLMELDVIGQINAASLLKRRTAKRCFKLIDDGFVQLLGTDFHRIDRGDAALGEAYNVLEKRYGADFIAEIEKNGEQIFSGVKI